VANTRRTRQKKTSTVQAVGQPGSTGLAELTKLFRDMAESGAPDEVLQVLEGAVSVEDGLGRLAEAGLLPSMEQSFEGLLEGFTPLLEPGCDQLSAELCGAEFLGMIRQASPGDLDMTAVLLEITEQAAGTRMPAALAMLRVLAAVGPAEVRPAAEAAGDKLVASGAADPPWAPGLGSPRPGPCFGYADDFGAQQSLTITFSYGRKRHALVALIDYDLGGGVKDCFVTDRPDRIRARYREMGREAGVQYRDYQAAEARAILDRALGREPCPVEPDQVEDVEAYLDLLRVRAELLPAGGELPTRRGDAGSRPAMTTAGRDIHRVKITLRGAKPPIWRRLEVPSGITLHRLHEVILRSFGWDGSHMWVFSTPDGEYGIADRELEFRSAASRKLSDAAPYPGERIRYTYDFGDGWEHDITVEDVLPAEPGVAYPRCTAGRRASPPEDCGGIWGYAGLLEILADPGSEEHAERLEWLGLESATDFDPAEFDLAHVNKMLTSRVLVKRQ
jgi:hypothetical protein